jgi:murein DD-endopeptidase MepM/ murein hydrolase activator NlpD
LVQAGMTVAVGDTIAAVGNSGASGEPHLHIHA